MPGRADTGGRARPGAWGPDGRRAAVTISFDNLGEVTDLARGLWPEDEPLGHHFSVTRALPRISELLAEVGLRATFFVEGRNTELYPDTLTGLAADGHEVAYHGWCHEYWADLEGAREGGLLEQGRDAMEALGLTLCGFRPPGGRLTASSLGLLGELGFTYCSPAGEGVGIRDGIVVLPFGWTLIDAYHYLPRFGRLRARANGSPDALPPATLAAALRAALRDAVDHGRHLSVLFHPFLLEDPERFAVLRRHLHEVRNEVRHGRLWCAPYADVARWIRAGAGGAAAPGGDLRLDPTPV